MVVDVSSKGAPGPVVDDVLTIDREGPIAIVSLNRPEARNSLSEALLVSLNSAVQDIGQDGDVHVGVLRAEGSVFCAGHDLKELSSHRDDSDGGRAFFEKIMLLCAEVMQGILSCPKPIVAAVQGTATAAGCQLVASADLAVASQSAKFCTPGVNIGLFCSTPMVALSRNLPRKRAMEMLLLGDMISAKEASDFGLVNNVVEANSVLPTALEMAHKISSKAPKVVGIGKRAFYEQVQMPVGDAYDYTAKIMVENMMMRDAEEGICAFFEKRPADWDKL